MYCLTIVENRYGMTTHLVFTVFGLMTNILVTAMLLTGGSAAFNALTGKHNTYLNCFKAGANLPRRPNTGGLFPAPSGRYYIHNVSPLLPLFRCQTVC